MKKLILAVSGVAGLSLASFGQGINFLDGSNPAYDVTINGAPNTSQDVNLELLYSSTATTSLDSTSGLNILTGSPVVTLLLSSTATATTGTLGQTSSAGGDISTFGYITDNSLTEYNLAAGTYDMQVVGWTGNYATYDAAASAKQDVGATSVFTVAVGAPPATAANVAGMGVLNLAPVAVPEPTTLAMAGVGLASMLIFRRKK